MKTYALAIGLALSLLSFNNLNAQTAKPATDDASAISATVRDYIEGYYTGDAKRMQKTLHPHYLKHMIHGDIPMREKTGEQMIRELRAHGVPTLPASAKSEQIQVLDVAGGIASAKLITPGWTDYITLSKLDGEWKVLSVVQQIVD